MTEAEVTRFIQRNAEEDKLRLDFMNAEEKDTEQPRETVKKRFNVSPEEPLPVIIQLILSDRIYIPKNGLPPNVIKRLIRLASFSNPDFYKTQAMRLSTYGKPRVISCGEDLSHHIALPRGCLDVTRDYFEQNNVRIELQDKRNEGTTIEASFTGTLTTLQDTSARAVLAHDIGILSAATAFGKTVVAANIISKRKVNTMIIVHRRELMVQLKQRLQTFLDIPKNSIGVIGGGKDKRTGIIDIAIIQSLNYKGEVKEFIGEYGQIIVDECHHVSAYSFEQVL